MEEEKEQQEKVPNLQLDKDQNTIYETHDVPIKINGTESKVVIRKLSSAERNKIRSSCAKTRIIAGQPNITVDDSEIQEKILSTCIIEAPFKFTLADIKEKPAYVIDYLYNEYVLFAEPTEKKNE